MSTEAGQHCIDEFESDGDNFHEVNEQSRKRQWTPLKLSNPEYLEFLKNRRNSDRNFIMENVVSIFGCPLLCSFTGKTMSGINFPKKFIIIFPKISRWGKNWLVLP